MARGKKSWFQETFWTVVYAVLIAIFIRTVAYEPFNIPSRSMMPTLLVGDYLFVSKFSYGYSKHSLPFSLPLIPGRVLFSEPKRGDVVVFKLPTDNKTDYIKRVIGLPGDRIQVINDVLHINGTAVKRQLVSRFDYLGQYGQRHTGIEYRETLPNGVEHSIYEDVIYENDNKAGGVKETNKTANTQESVVPEGHYFMMGDNRDNSSDSRVIGVVPKENLVGRAEFLFFSIDSANGTVWKIWKWPQALRFNRIFDGIE